jgi:hypothetical protein
MSLMKSELATTPIDNAHLLRLESEMNLRFFELNAKIDRMANGVAASAERVDRAVRLPWSYRGPFGSPNTRSPMMLRWISAVPPAMVSENASR